MKTINLRLILTIASMVAVLASAGQSARGSKNDNRGNQNNKNENVNVEKRSDYRDNVRYRGETRPVSREIDRKAVEKREIRKVETQKKVYVYHAPAKVVVPDHFRGNRYYYYAPEYGHAVRNFHASPVVFHAKGNNKFYYFNDHFYRYRKGVGYIWIDNPYGMIFNKLPHGAILVNINGRPYYRYGDVFFAHSPFGFEVVKLPARYYHKRPSVYISASF